MSHIMKTRKNDKKKALVEDLINMHAFVKSIVGAAAFLVSAGLFVEASYSKVILKEKVTYYKVTGSSGKDIFKSMLKNGPRIGRRDDHALATTEFDYEIQNIDVAIERGRCVAKNLDIVVSVKYLYPRWRKSNSASKATRTAWNKFEKAVIWHEGQHVKIALDYAKEYEKVLKKMKLRVSNDCSRASALSRFGAMRAILKHNRKQKQFDRRDLKRGGRGYKAQLELLNAK